MHENEIRCKYSSEHGICTRPNIPTKTDDKRSAALEVPWLIPPNNNICTVTIENLRPGACIFFSTEKGNKVYY